MTTQVTEADTRLLDPVFTPNASVCVRFDARGRPVEAAVDGSRAAKDVNGAMLKLLQSRQWDVPRKALLGKWVAMSIAPDGSPVPEVLPDCSDLKATH
jgi:hypothetical protein